MFLLFILCARCQHFCRNYLPAPSHPPHSGYTQYNNKTLMHNFPHLKNMLSLRPKNSILYLDINNGYNNNKCLANTEYEEKK